MRAYLNLHNQVSCACQCGLRKCDANEETTCFVAIYIFYTVVV